jgi:hypothetical protein
MAKSLVQVIKSVAPSRPARPTGRFRRADSSALAGFSYNKSKQILTVVFARSGDRYRYLDVPQEVFDGLSMAGSHGLYFNANIKDNYDYEQV